MNLQSEIKRSLLPLPLSAIIWLSFYAVFHFYAQNLKIPGQISLFLSATLLTVLSAAVVYGFSCLRLHRSIYLLIGLSAAVLTFNAAKPMVIRSAAINESGAIPGFIILATADISGLNTPAQNFLMPMRNALFSELSSATADNIPEIPLQIALLALCQLMLASGIGLWIGEGIDEAAHLIPVALVATIADIWSVSAGATAKIIISPIINYFLLRFPVAGTSEIPYLIGLTDFLFFALFFQAARRFELGMAKNLILLLTSFFIAVAAAIFTSTGLPVLPFMAILFVAGNFNQLKLKREEMKQIAIFLVVILIVFAIISTVFH